MRRKVVDWKIDRLNKEKAVISFPEYQREKELWPDDKKSMLIDSILRDIDIPKLYFNRIKDGNYEVIDGQQRLWSIWQFLADDFPYKVDRKETYFSKLSAAQKEKINSYPLQVTEFQEADDDYLRELFVRLQLGFLLNTGEKLHASKGAMKQLVFGKLWKHKFISKLGMPSRRFAKETLCAQIAINAFSHVKQKSYARTRYDDLLHFFGEYVDPQGKDLDLFKKMSRRIENVLDKLWECFGEDTKDLKNRSYILSLYLFVDELLEAEDGMSEAERKLFKEFSFRLWKRLREEMKLGMDRVNRELYAFQALLSSAPGEEYQIQRRHEKLKEYFEYFRSHGKKIKGDK